MNELQEVPHAETMGGAPVTWQKLIVDWMAAKAGMVLLTKTFQATNTIAIWIKRNLLGMVRHIPVRLRKATIVGEKNRLPLREKHDGRPDWTQRIHRIENSVECEQWRI